MNGQQPGGGIENGVLWYASDSSGDFRSKHKIPEGDIATLQILNQTWAKDKKSVWALGEKVLEADFSATPIKANPPRS